MKAIAITERLPDLVSGTHEDRSERVLVYDIKLKSWLIGVYIRNHRSGYVYWEGDDFGVDGYDYNREELTVSHWMPLPTIYT
jgi:hypothetical protein